MPTGRFVSFKISDTSTWDVVIPTVTAIANPFVHRRIEASVIGVNILWRTILPHMLKIVLALICAVLLPPLQAQTAATEKTSATPVPSVFTFDEDSAGKMPTGWGGGPANTVAVDDSVAHSGRNSVRLAHDSGSAQSFSVLTKHLPLNYLGDTLELRGFLRTEGVSDFAGLWMREDQDGAAVAFDNMQSRGLKGTTGWTEYSIKLPLRPGAQILYFGVLNAGTGKLWADDLRLTLDGKPFSDAPKIERPETVLDHDHQFDSGSGIILQALSPVQIDNLVMLGKVWGFLKYYHPAITSGQKHWDYELFRITPAILAASDHKTAQSVLAKWVDSLGSVKPCSPCVDLEKDALKLTADITLRPDRAWILDEEMLGRQLSQSLTFIERNRIANQQFYVSLAPQVHNPLFEHELSYQQVKLPDAGYQLLALYRFWNIFEYWSPYRAIVGENWDSVLRQFIPRVMLAKDATQYPLELMALIAEAHDGHANLWSSLQLRPPSGPCRLPVNVRFIPGPGGKNQAVVASFAWLANASPDGEATGLKPGDVLESLEGKPLDALIASWAPYYADSNETARLRDIASTITNGECIDVKVGIRRGNKALQITAKRLLAKDMATIGRTHDLPGDTFRLLTPDVAYLKLSSVKTADIGHYLEAASKTKGMIIDIRNYPAEFVVFSLGTHLVDKPTPFARFTTGDLSTPGAFYWTPPATLTPTQPHYAGKVVILVDEVSLSQAEYTAMAFRAAP
jgi:hypothetical protein